MTDITPSPKAVSESSTYPYNVPRFRHGLAGWGLVLVVALLLAQFALRSQNILAQQPYLDEGFHIKHAATVYDFEAHPGRVAHGKILIYFYLGVFEAAPSEALFMGRMALALFSLLTGATLVRLGTMLHRQSTGLVALLLFAVMPLAFFFDRMALSDGFVTTFMVLALIQSWRVVRRPSLVQGAVLGVILALMTLAKLTAGLIPFLAPMLALLYYRQPLRQSARRYLPPLALAAGVVVLMWLPILIPALLAADSDAPFTLVDSNAFNEVRSNPLRYAQIMFPKVLGFVHPFFILLFFGVVAYWYRVEPSRRLHMSVLFLWMVLFVGLILLTARISSARYFAPVAAMLAVVLAYALTTLWQDGGRSRLVVLGAAGGLVLWGALFVMPFAYHALYEPTELSFYGGHNNEYKTQPDGVSILENSGAAMDALGDENTPRFAQWWYCYMLYFYTEHDLICLPRVVDEDALLNTLHPALDTGGFAFVLWNRDPINTTTAQLQWESIISDPQQVWRLSLQEVNAAE